MSELEVRRTYDAIEIRKILEDKEIFERVSEDGQSIGLINIPLDDSNHWVGAYIDDLIIGVFWLHPISLVCGYIHTQILKQYRREHAANASTLMLGYMVDNTEYLKFETKIPVIYENVHIYGLAMGFKDEGVSRQSFLKDGGLHDQYCMGVTRQEIYEWFDDGVMIWRR